MILGSTLIKSHISWSKLMPSQKSKTILHILRKKNVNLYTCTTIDQLPTPVFPNAVTTLEDLVFCRNLSPTYAEIVQTLN